MRHFKLTIAYDGTDFHGWQIQSNKPTIQGEISNVLRQLTQENVMLNGAGRTDAGVHALGQVASFRTPAAHAGECDAEWRGTHGRRRARSWTGG